MLPYIIRINPTEFDDLEQIFFFARSGLVILVSIYLLP